MDICVRYIMKSRPIRPLTVTSVRYNTLSKRIPARQQLLNIGKVDQLWPKAKLSR